MGAGHYAVIRYVPDPVQNEPINIGVIVQASDGSVFCRISPEALERLSHLDPLADTFGIRSLETHFTKVLSAPRWLERHGEEVQLHPGEPDYLLVLSRDAGEHLKFTEPRFVSLEQNPHEAVSDLLKRFVSPLKRRANFFPAFPAKQTLKKSLAPWIRNKRVSVDYVFEGASGLSRKVDFYYVNGHHALIRTVRLDASRDSSVYHRAEREACEVLDILRGNEGPQWSAMAVCEFPEDRTVHMVRVVRNIFGLVNCKVFDAHNELEGMLGLIKQDLGASSRL